MATVFNYNPKVSFHTYKILVRSNEHKLNNGHQMNFQDEWQQQNSSMSEHDEHHA